MKLKGTAKKFDDFAKKIIVPDDIETYKMGVEDMLEKAENEDAQLSIVLANFLGQTLSNIIDMLFIFAKDLTDEKEKKNFYKQAEPIMISQINVLFEHYKSISEKDLKK